MKFRRQAYTIEAVQYDPNQTPPSGVSHQSCNCMALAQDGRRCELHQTNGRRWGETWDGKREVHPGDWIITASNEPGFDPLYPIIVRQRDFGNLYEPYSIDYKNLLKKYMGHISNQEGTTHTGISLDLAQFTSEEKEALRSLNPNAIIHQNPVQHIPSP